MTSHAGPEGPVLFRTIAVPGPWSSAFGGAQTHTGFKGAVGFARCLAGFARRSSGGNWIFCSV